MNKKNILIRISIKKHLHELKRREKRKKKRLENLNEKKWKKIIFYKRNPPKNFSLINNTNNVLSYFEKYEKEVWSIRAIDFDLWNISNLSFDAVAFLLVKVNEFSKEVLIKWLPPKNPSLNKLFKESDFYSFVSSNLNINDIEIKAKAINHKSSKIVSPEIAWAISDYIDSWIDIITRKHFYSTLIECMQNTNNHAWECNWWVFIHDNTEKWIKEICFIDLWIWILWSLNTKFENFKDIIWPFLWNAYNIDKIFWLFKWKWWWIESITKEKKRWNWLKDIYNFSQNLNVREFIVITNDIKINLKNNNSQKLKYNFKWTLYYWEI